MMNDPQLSTTRRHWRHLMLSLLVITSSSATARELIVHGNVVEVQPITSSRQIAEATSNCHTRPLAPDDSLADLLAWDLRAGCPKVYRSEESITGYRVVYEWDGRAYTRVMREPPGETVALRVSVD
jgi:uncharacterized protein YcfJ